MSSILACRLPAMAAALLVAAPALAHHPMGGALVGTFGEGLLSGLGHPIIGLDHLAALVAVGVIAASLPGGVVLPLAFVAASLAGVGLHLALVDLPVVEIVIALSVIALGALLAVRPPLNAALLAVLFAAAGLFHGYAYGESIIGAEPTPLLAYLLGLGVVQTAIAGGIALLARQLVAARPALARGTGAAVALVGAIALVGAL